VRGLAIFSEVFVEAWDLEREEARQQRDERLVELVALGYDCQALDLWNVEGRRVFLLEAEPPASASSQRQERRSTRESEGERRTRPQRRSRD
jgi:hypothetical protein